MNLQQVLGIERGVTAVIGSGGKTTLLAALASELDGTVALTTTTHIMPFGGIWTTDGGDAQLVQDLLARHRVVCVGQREQVSLSHLGADAASLPRAFVPFKLVPGKMSPAELALLADYVLVEADGSKHLPLKAHASWEPVIPEGCTQTVLVAGASGFGRPVAEAAHRPEIFCQLAGCTPEDIATPERIAATIRAEGLATRVVVNQCEGEEALARARKLAGLLDMPVAAGSVRDGHLKRLE